MVVFLTASHELVCRVQLQVLVAFLKLSDKNTIENLPY